MTPEDEAFNEIEKRSKVKQDILMHPSKEAQLIAEVAVLTEMVRLLSDKVNELDSKQKQGNPVSDPFDCGTYVGSHIGKEVKHSIGDDLPAQKPWVGLTDLERAEITKLKWWDWEDSFDVDGFTRAVEAKLKEKNT
jgi:hypothetical protein